MDFWNQISKTITDAADYTVKETEKLTGIAKLKYRLNSLKMKCDSYYKTLGEIRYSEYKYGAVEEDKYSPILEQIDQINSEIAEIEARLNDLRDYMTCPQCSYRLQKGLCYCPKCGEKLNK